MATKGERWQKLIDVTGASQTMLATIAGVNKSNISRYLKDVYAAKDDVVKRVCDVYGISKDWLNGEDVPMYQYEDANFSKLWNKLNENSKRIVTSVAESVYESQIKEEELEGGEQK